MGAPLDLAEALGRLSHSLERPVGQGADEVHWDMLVHLDGLPADAVNALTKIVVS